MQRGTFRVLQSYLKKKEKNQINNLTLHLKQLDKEEMENPRVSRRKERKKVKSLTHFKIFVSPWTIVYQAPPSMECSIQEYWSGLPFPSPENLPDPGIEPGSPTLQVDALLSVPPGKPNNSNKLQSCRHLVIHLTHRKGTSYVKTKTPSGKFEVLDYPGVLFVVSITL